MKNLDAESRHKLTLRITGLGHIPSKKNYHFPLANGGLGIDKEVKLKMDRITRALEFELRSCSPTTEGATLMGHGVVCLTALLKHSKTFDDSRQWISEIHIYSRDVDKGQEGCIVEIGLIPEINS